MQRINLDPRWIEDVRMIEADLDGCGLHVMCMCLIGRFPDGIPHEELERRNVPADLVQRLVDLGLLEELQGRLFPIFGPNRLVSGRRWIPTGLRRLVMERDGRRCVECGATDRLSLDHIVPYSHGGPDTEDNLRVLCKPCNSRKGARP